MRKLFLIICSLIAGVALYSKPIDLSGVWQLLKAGDDKFEALPANVPGDVHSALLQAGIIENPYFSDNELKNLWVGREDWIIRRSFVVDKELLSHKAIYFRAEDIDTFCDIFINGKKVGNATNRFRRWEWDIKNFLVEGENIIEGYFHSAEIKSEEISGNIPYQVPLAENLSRVSHINLIRKPTCHGGWDWGPCQMVTGFAGKVELRPVDIADINYVMCDQDFSKDGKCTVCVNVEFISPEGGMIPLTVKLGNRSKHNILKLSPGYNKRSVKITIDKPELWWPNGMGSQKLYDLSVITGESSVNKKIGLRKIEVVNKADTVYGKSGYSMSFKVNNKDVYVKGANWIPCDLFETRQTYSHYLDILSSAKNANMNMVRVWGGGQFEHDEFYEICDSLGIMIWHDFMFSCSTYPGTQEFLDEVESELNHQIRRLKDHASIAMWCGDNECVGALGWFECTRNNRDFYTANYDKLVKLRDKVVKTLDPDRVYWPSSPCAGFGDYTTDNWKEDSKGDMHLWSVSKEALPLNEYYKIKPRFCSEYGHSSFSSYDLTLTYCSNGQVNPWSPDFLHHQKEYNGNKIIFDRLFMHFQFPNKVKDLFYLSQIEQVMGLKTSSEYWRTLKPLCMGSIIWQLNDIWPGTSWSSIEYSGKWKQSHYHIKRFFAPELITAVPLSDSTAKMSVLIVNDNVESRQYSVLANIRDFDGNIIESRKMDKMVNAASSAEAFVLDLGIGKDCLKKGLSDKFLELKLYYKGELVSYNDFLFTEYKYANLQKAYVLVEPFVENGRYKVKLSTDKPAFFVWLNVSGLKGEFSDNSFTLYPDEPRVVEFIPKEKIADFESFKSSLEVMNLSQTYL